MVADWLLDETRRRVLGRDESSLRLQRYVILSTLGAGGSATVFDAYDPLLDRKVALKVYKSRTHEDPTVIETLLRQGRALAALRHPNVVTVYDAGCPHAGDHEPDCVFLVLELVAGAALLEFAAQTRDLAALVHVFVGMAQGLAAAHAVGITHGDLKPDNVLVRADGEACLCDFSLEASTAGPIYVTEAYVAPERGRYGAADPLSDQFALGKTIRDALRQWARAQPGRRIPAWLGALCRRASDPDPSRRYRDLDALIRALRHGAIHRRRLCWMAAIIAVLLLALALWGGS